jgi:hypothetical protein
MTLRVQGEGRTPAEIAQAMADFLSMLRRCSGLTLTLNPQTGDITEGASAGNPPAARRAAVAGALRRILQSRRRLVIKVRKAARRGDPIIDNYCQRRIILDHIDAFPATPPAQDPSATTRCEVLAHVLAEYAFALNAGSVNCTRGFAKAHKAGGRAQKAHRDANGQRNAPPHSNDLKTGPRSVIFRHCDGTTTVAEQDARTGAVSVSHTRAPRRPARRVSKVIVPRSAADFRSLLDAHAFAFAGTIDLVEKAPGVWSNFGLSHHAVVYRDVDWLKGGLSEFSARVHHLCVEDAVTMDKSPGLSERLFVPGRRIVVFCDLASDPEVKGGVRLEANEPDSFVELSADFGKEIVPLPDF